MNKFKKPIQIVRPGILLDNEVMLGEKYVRLRKIPSRQPITLRFGAMNKEVVIVPTANLKGVRISDSLAGSLGIPSGISLSIKYSADKRTLTMGPLIGVLVSRASSKKIDRPFGPITAFCKELHHTCQLYGAHVYFFTPDDIGNNPESVTAWSYADGWHKSRYPAPNVVYNRLTSRKYENKASVQHFLKEVKSRYKTSVFNEKYLNKTEVFAALRQSTALRTFLPESHAFKNAQTLKKMCDKYRVVFLKPITGSLGKGIMRVSRTDSGYICQFSGINRTIQRTFPNLSSLFYTVREKMKRNRYQIQQGLNLISVKGRPVDFRALVQRNEKGEWEVTSIVGRIAGNHHFVSNLARGGSLGSVSQVLQSSNLSSSRVKSTLGQLRKASLLLAKGVETNIEGHFGELGIDLGVDVNGKVWLIEINSKPSKDDNTSLNSKVRPSVRKFVQYARYLAKFRGD